MFSDMRGRYCVLLATALATESSIHLTGTTLIIMQNIHIINTSDLCCNTHSLTQTALTSTPKHI